MKKTVLILGAGASADYGYPLWDGLKKQMLNLDLDEVLVNELQLSSEEANSHRRVFKEFQDIVSKEPMLTLDNIVYRIDQPRKKHKIPTGHLLINLAGYLLAKVEVDRKDGQWITEIQDIIVDYIAENSGGSIPVSNLLKNIHIISLNYDRVFEHFISVGFYDKLIGHSSYDPPDARYSGRLSRENKIHIVKPHGSMCGLGNNNSTNHVGMYEDLIINAIESGGTRYPGNRQAIRYGDRKICDSSTFLRMGRHMYVVDERDEEEYQRANNTLKSAEQVICLGLSPAGICQSTFDFPDGMTVYVSNKGSEIDEISACKPGANYISLGSNTKRLDCKEFPDKFKSLVL